VSSIIAVSASYYFYGGLAMNLCGIIEFIRGNAFPAAAYVVYGCFWCELGWAYDPLQNLGGAYDVNGVAGSGLLNKDFTSGQAMFWLALTLASFVLFIGTIRTNVALSLAVFCLIPLFALFSAAL
jgi:uncharacterized protein